MKKIKKYIYNITVTRIVDGDTIEASIDLGFKLVLSKIIIRSANIDTPELGSVRPLEVTAAAKVWNHVREILKEGTETVFESTGKPDKFGRALGRILLSSGLQLDDYLIAQGLAKSYHGDKKSEWTDEELKTIIDKKL